jgi:hypothetical protein
MTLPTSVLAVSAANYGSPDESLQYIKKLHQSFSYALPGSMYEVSPDFGMMTQAWNIYGVAVPIVQHFFGIKPKAYERTVYLSPHLPTDWKDASIAKVKVGDNSISLAISIKEDHTEYRIQQSLEDWTTVVDVRTAKKVLVNNQEIDLKSLATGLLSLNGSENVVTIY